jgi:glycerophosphoryl diester phosphodiesterase
MRNLFLLFGILLAAVFSCNGNGDAPVDPVTKPLTVEFTANNRTPVVFETVSFAAKVAGGSGGASVAWDFGDGFTAIGITAQHGFRAEGTYTVSVTVSNDGEAVNAAQVVTVAGYSLSKALKNFDRSRVWIMAHRCNHDDLTVPENSISALERCIAMRETVGIDFVEIDPRTTLDGILVNMHDETVNRTTNGAGRVSDMTLAQFQGLRLKARNGAITDEHPPTIREFLLAAKDKMYVNLDFITRNVSYEALYNLVKECGMIEQCLFPCSNEMNVINSLLLYSPQPIIRSSVSNQSQITGHKEAGLYVTTVSAPKVMNNTDVTGLAVGAGFTVMCQTLVQDGITIDNDIKQRGDYSGVDIFLDKGINIIQTDQPVLLNTYLKSKNKR